MMNKNKIQIWIMALCMLLVVAIFSFFHTVVGSGGEGRTFSFPTSTPTIDPVGGGWWDTMPTANPVETISVPTAISAKKP